MIVREENSVRVILVDRLPPEVLAKVQALYARRPESMEVHLGSIYAEMREALRAEIRSWNFEPNETCLDAIMAFMDSDGASAAKFMEQWYVGYGHASVGDCAVGAVLGIEGISQLACKALQHWPLFSGLETSTRAVDFAKAELCDPIGTPASKAVLDRWMAFYNGSQGRVAAEVRRRYPRQERVLCEACREHLDNCPNPAPGSRDGCGGVGCVRGENEKTYESAVKMRTFDILRGVLPAAIKTQTSLAMNLRQLSDHLTWALVHPLEEVRRVARLLQSVLRERYPASGSFGGSAALSGVGTKGTSAEEAAARDAWVTATAAEWTYHDENDRPGRGNRPNSLELGEFSTTVDVGVLRLPGYRKLLRTRPRGCVLPRVLDGYGTCTASFLLDWGAWRDIERQRSMTCRVPMLTMEYGFEEWYLEQLPDDLRGEAETLICEQAYDIERLTDDLLLRQYYIPMGFRVPTTLTGPLPAWAYVLELRTGPNVHPTLRNAMLEVAADFERTFGDAVPLHLDRRPDVWSVRRGVQVIEKRSVRST